MLLLNHTCDVWRKQALGTNGRKQLQAYKTAVPCLAMPMSTAATIRNGYSVGHAYEVYYDDGADVRIGDQIKVNGLSLMVKVVRPYVGMPPVSHVEVECEEVTA
jgi:hypothetical protein